MKPQQNRQVKQNAFLPFLKAFLICAAVFTVSACAADETAESKDPAAKIQKPLPRVFAVTVEAKDIRVERSFSARAEGSMVAEVTARASGQIEAREFKEGELVEAGTVMFRIEKAPYEVTLQQAKADVSQAEAEFSTAKRDWNRVANLYDDGAISARDHDKAKSTLETAEAALESAKASLDDASLRYNYTDVKAPITGVASRERVSIGNVVGEGDSLAVITSLDPLYVRFAVPEQGIAARYLLEHTALNKLAQEGRAAHEQEALEEKQVPKVRLTFSDGRTHDQEGYIDFVSRVIDKNTGNMEARAVVPNPDMSLLPGQFIRVELPEIIIPQAISVPQRAVVQSGRRSVVYVVDAQNTVQVREVTLGVRIDSEQLIREGLKTGDRVIVEGLSMLQAGAEVRVEPFE